MGVTTIIEQKERQDFVSLGCGTYLNKVQYNTVVIIYDTSVIEPCNNTVGANSVDY